MANKIAIIASAALTAVSIVSADLCALGSAKIDGNWFCQPVQAIRYSNVGSSGSYKQIVNMTASGECESIPKKFSGPLAPLDEEVSLHFRGPLQLKSLAAYKLTTSTEKRRQPGSATSQHHEHQHQRANQRQKHNKLKRATNDVVTAAVNGKIVSWENIWNDEMGVQMASSSAEMVTATIDGVVVSWVNDYFGPTSLTTTSTSAQSQVTSTVLTSTVSSSSDQGARLNPTERAALDNLEKVAKANAADVKPSDAPFPGARVESTYERIGYYHSATQTLENMVFLGNYGGNGSGVFDNEFGASLAYANQKGTGGAATPQILADTVIPSDSEVIIMLGADCNDGSCGFTRPGTVAHHGFDGADKVFLVEFSMPKDGATGFNADMPAIWMLNAQIPRTLQYGRAECSCWNSGCGELDIAETLSSGSTYMKSTLHTNQPGGASDYLLRPTTGTMILAVIFDSSEAAAHIQVLPANTMFPESLTAAASKGSAVILQQARYPTFGFLESRSLFTHVGEFVVHGNEGNNVRICSAIF